MFDFLINEDDNWGDTLKTVLYAILIAVLIRTFAFEPFKIPSGSMYPSLYVGDYLFVSKYSYGYSQYSLPYGIPLIKGRILNKAPKRGDVVVFKLPRDNKTDYIKRVIGMPGDKIQVINGVLNINGEPVKREKIEEFVMRDENGNAIRYYQYIETLPNGVEHKIIELSDNNDYDNTPEYIVPEGHYFMMGDNRDRSDDSRVSVGFVPEDNLVGRAEILFFSTDGSSGFLKIWRWPSAIRWERLFDRIV